MTIAKSFVMPERGLKCFVIPHVQPCHLVSTCICNDERGRGAVTK
jgi:hypothetical protein